jgi:hypothetical protein
MDELVAVLGRRIAEKLWGRLGDPEIENQRRKESRNRAELTQSAREIPECPENLFLDL